MPGDSPAARLHTALDMFEVGVSMMRCRLRRKLPDASEGEIDAALTAWLQHRPGAESGDYPGPASTRRIPT